MKIAVCDDKSIQLSLINSYIEEWAKSKDINITIDNYKSAEAFLFEWLDEDKYDIIFLDINMDKMSGVELSNIIREKNKLVDIVFVTGIFKYALHGYKVRALQYLIKPINKLDLHSCLDNTLERINYEEQIGTFINIETQKKNIKLDYSKIRYCIMFSPYIDIHTTSEIITLRKKISDIEEILPRRYFIRSHRSYLVNVKYIKSISKKEVLLDNDVKIPISRGKYNDINEAFINYICN